MAPDTRAQAVATRVLRILSRHEMALFAETFGQPPDSTIDHLSRSLAALPRYEITRIVLQLASSTIRLLQDVFACLGALGVSVRTTGCVFVLADPLQPGQKSELEFSPQAVGTVATWRDRLPGPMVGAIEDLTLRWVQLQSPLSRILKAAVPRREEGDIDILETAIQNRLAQARGETPPGLVREPDRSRRNEGAERVLRLVSRRAAELSARLSESREGPVPPDVSWILDQTNDFLRRAQKVLPKPRTWRETADPSQFEIRPHERFLRDFDRLREDLFLLADLTEGDRLFDMLRLDVWSSRPQLYEVWVLLTILRWLADRGYGVELLKIGRSGGMPKWELAYSKDDEPCARIEGNPGTSAAYLFYQLYRPSGDMPDLALLNGSDPGSGRVWTVDPKHSEQRTYSIKNYRTTAERYRDSFGSPRSIIAEYFERTDCESNPVDFGNGAELVHDCQPGGRGLALLLHELSDSHPVLPVTLVCIDVSQSFRDRLGAVLPRVKAMIDADAGRYLDDCIWFAGRAARRAGLRSLMESSSMPDASSLGLGDGTLADPLLQAIAEAARVVRIRRVILVTDGGFDVPLEAVLQRIRNDLRLEIDVIADAANTSARDQG